MNDVVQHLLGGGYMFLDPDAILNEFRLSEGGPDVFCTYSEAKGFAMQCPRSASEEKFASFLGIVKRYIDIRSKEEADVFEIPKLGRRMSAEIDKAVFHPTNETANYDADYQNGYGKQGAIGPQLIDHESIITTWNTPQNPIKDTSVLREIGNTTSCRVEYDGTIDRIVIRGEDADGVDKAIAKLDLIKVVNEQRDTGQWNVNFYVHENETDFLLRLAAPRKLVDRQLIATTRTHPFSYLEVAMVKWNVQTQKHDFVLFESHALQSSRNACRLWEHHVYKEFGDEGSNPVHWAKDSTPSSVISGEGSVHPILPTDKFSSLSQWNEKAASTKSDPFRPLDETSDGQSGSKNGGENINIHPARPKPKPYIKTLRVAKGQTTTTNSILELSQRPASGSSMKKMNISPALKSSLAEPAAANAVTPTSDIGEIPLEVVPPPILEPYLPKDFFIPQSQGIRKGTWRGNIVREREKSRISLMGAQVPKTNWVGVGENGIVEKKQNISESETREYQRGSNLKASSKNSQAKVDDITASKIIESASIILEPVKSTSGQIRLDVNLGRLYIDGRNVPSEFRNKPFPASEWSALFVSHSVLRYTPTVFSSLLTTSWVDAEYVLDLKLPRDQRIFSESVLQSSVVYEFKCRNSRTSAEVLIAFNDDGSYKIHNTPEIAGTANLYFPKRVWDARLSVTEYTVATIENQETFKHIIENLYIEPGSTIPKLYTKTVSSAIEIQSIIVKRQTQHSCHTYPDLVLQLTECEDLIIQKSSPRQYRAFAWAPDRMVADENRLWWEASITSKAAQEILRENLSLEVGEYTQWTPQNFVDQGIIQDLYSLAKDVVTRIDNVGCNTPALTGYAEFNTRTRSKRSEEDSEERRRKLLLW